MRSAKKYGRPLINGYFVRVLLILLYHQTSTYITKMWAWGFTFMSGADLLLNKSLGIFSETAILIFGNLPVSIHDNLQQSKNIMANINNLPFLNRHEAFTIHLFRHNLNKRMNRKNVISGVDNFCEYFIAP